MFRGVPRWAVSSPVGTLGRGVDQRDEGDDEKYMTNSQANQRRSFYRIVLFVAPHTSRPLFSDLAGIRMFQLLHMPFLHCHVQHEQEEASNVLSFSRLLLNDARNLQPSCQLGCTFSCELTILSPASEKQMSFVRGVCFVLRCCLVSSFFVWCCFLSFASLEWCCLSLSLLVGGAALGGLTFVSFFGVVVLSPLGWCCLFVPLLGGAALTSSSFLLLCAAAAVLPFLPSLEINSFM